MTRMIMMTRTTATANANDNKNVDRRDRSLFNMQKISQLNSHSVSEVF